MAAYVFISHSSKDKGVAVATCDWLEARGFRCWVAPRDIRPGANWGGSIVQGIRESKVMVLLFSSHANASPQIKREVERAVHFGVTIIPMRIENVYPEDDLEYFLGTPHWLDAFSPPLEKHLDLLSRALSEIFKTPIPSPVDDKLKSPAKPPPLPILPSKPKVELSPNNRPPLKAPDPLPIPEAMLHETRTVHEVAAEGLTPLPERPAVGSFTTSLAASSMNRIGVTIPDGFLSAGTPGTFLRLVPVEQLRSKPALEIYIKTGTGFSFGRSPEADWIACFFPRNEKNDLRSKRLSKIHARIEYRDDQLWAYRVGGNVAHIGTRPIGNDPNGASLRERDQLVLAEDYTLEIYYDISLRGTLRFINGDAWQAGKIEFNPTLMGAIRFDPLSSTLAIRNSCWLFTDVGFGSARGGVLTAGSELAPEQGVILNLGGCFWILNLVDNEKVDVNDYRLAAKEMVALTRDDSVWLGSVRYRVEIG